MQPPSTQMWWWWDGVRWWLPSAVPYHSIRPPAIAAHAGSAYLNAIQSIKHMEPCMPCHQPGLGKWHIVAAGHMTRGNTNNTTSLTPSGSTFINDDGIGQIYLLVSVSSRHTSVDQLSYPTLLVSPEPSVPWDNWCPGSGHWQWLLALLCLVVALPALNTTVR